MKNLKAIELKGIDRSGGRFTDMGILQEAMNVAKRKSGLYEIIGKKEVKEEYVFDLESYDFLYRFPALDELIGALDSEHKVYRITPTTETEILTYTGNIQLITHLGNILIIHTDLNGYNIKYDPDADTFTELSDLPVPRSFLTTSNVIGKLTNTASKVTFAEAVAEMIDKNAQANKAGIAEGHLLGKLAWRLFDNSYVKHSNPISCQLSNLQDPILVDKSSGYIFYNLHYYKIRGRYKLYATDLTALEGWRGVVTSLCLFITVPRSLYLIDSEESAYDWDGDVGSPQHNSAMTTLDQTELEYYKIHEIPLEDILAGDGDVEFLPEMGPIDILPTKTLLTVDDSSHHLMLSKSAYLYNSRLHYADVRTILSTGLNQDYLLSTVWLAELGYTSYTLKAPSDTWTMKVIIRLRTSQGERLVYKLFYDTDDSDTTELLIWEKGGSPDIMLLNPVLSYPDIRAYQMEILLSNGVNYYRVGIYNLTPHAFHNQATYLNYDDTDKDIRPIEIDLSSPGTAISINDFLASDADYNKYIDDTNRIQVTGLNNPFTFPSANSYRVGAHGNIVLKSCAMGEAISQGQFGQFPLYAFSSQGIYALQVGSGEVLYASILPLNSDVVSNINSVINVGAGVVYATTRGLFLISGSQVMELSGTVEGKLDNPILTNNDYLGYLNTDCLVTLSGYLSSVPFIDYLADAVIGFDRKNRELIVSKKEASNLSDFQGSGSGSGERDWPGTGVGIPMIDDASRAGYSYVYSFLSKEWTKITQRWYSFLDSYPDILGVVGNCVYNLCEESSEANQYLVQTRPITLAQHTFKKICSANLYGHFEPEANTFHSFYVFGSQDGQKWYLLQGQQQPFSPHECVTIQRADGWCKYFIFLVAGQLSLDSILEHIEVEFDERYKSKLR
jgi:hypothetical protein